MFNYLKTNFLWFSVGVYFFILSFMVVFVCWDKVLYGYDSEIKVVCDAWNRQVGLNCWQWGCADLKKSELNALKEYDVFHICKAQ